MPDYSYLYTGTQPTAQPYTGTTTSNPLALSTTLNSNPVTYSNTITSGQTGTTPTGGTFNYAYSDPNFLINLFRDTNTVNATNTPTTYYVPDITGPVGSSITDPTGTPTSGTTSSGTGIARLPGTTTGTTGGTTGTTTSTGGTVPLTPPTTSSIPSGLNNQEYQNTYNAQLPTNVLDVRNTLLGMLGSYNNMATNAVNNAENLPLNTNLQLKSNFTPSNINLQNWYDPNRLNLKYNFQGGDQLQNIMANGPDAIAQNQMAAGIQDINARRDAENQRLINQLGINPGNSDLLSVLQGQNTFQSQLATNPLRAQALQDTLERAQAAIGLTNEQIGQQNQTAQAQTDFNNNASLTQQQTANQNAMQQAAYNQQNQYLANQLYNQALLQQGGFNQQASLAKLQALLAGMQPSQNLLEALTNLQGQARGTVSSETNVGARNFT